MELTAEEQLELEKLEESLFTPFTQQTQDSLETLLADEFLEFGSSGQAYNKQQTIVALSQTTTSEAISLSQFHARRLAKNLVLVTYRSEKRLTDRVLYALRSSIWRQTRNGWRIIFHQGTPTDHDTHE